MRQTIEIRVLYGLGLIVLLGLSSVSHAAVIAGRVVDGDGRPLANAEVRIWQKLPGPENQRVSDQPVRYAEGEGGDVLRTDANGRFETPDVVAPEAFARVFVDAEGMLTARGDWIEIRQETSPHVVKIVMRRLCTVIGQVLDRRQRPVAGVTVFHVGDAPEKIETQTDRDGKFQLPGVPEGRVFLFAEKSGYRFTGMLSAGDQDATMTLSRLDEPVEPLNALPPLLSHEEELALARRMIEPALEASRSGNAEQKESALQALAELDPVEAFDRAAAMDFHDNPQRGQFDAACVRLCIEGRAGLSWDDLRTYIESSNNHQATAAQFCAAVRRMGDHERARRLEWLGEALLHARHIENLPGRAETLANVAGAFLQAGERDRATAIIADAEKEAERLPLGQPESSTVVRALNLVLAKINPQRAIEHLERQKQPVFYEAFAAELAVWLLPEHPDEAEDIWRRAHARRVMFQEAAATRMRRFQWDIEFVADLCYKLAQFDRSRAERLARGESFPPTRVYGLGAVALALSETDPAAARELLASVVRDELARLDPGEVVPAGYSAMAPPVVAAALLPIAKQIDQHLAHECFWRSLALRSPRGAKDLDGQTDERDAGLGRMLSRYDREAARVLLAPWAARLPQIAAAAATTLRTPQALVIGRHASRDAHVIVNSAILIDPRWAARLIEQLPRRMEDSYARPREAALQTFAAVLAKPYDERWAGPGTVSWKPRGAPPLTSVGNAPDGEQSGIGVAVAEKDGKILIASVFPNSPAAASGALHADDRIIAIGQGDDMPVAADSLSFEQVIAAIRGQRGSTVRLTIVPEGQEDDEAVVVSLTRGVIKELNFFGHGTKLQEGSDAPNLNFTRLDGGDEHIDDLKGKIVVLCFWASWCGPCKPLVERLQMLPAQKPGWGDRVRVLALSVDEKKETALQVGREHHWDKAHLGWCGPDGMHVFDVSSLPKFFVIDTRGKIAAFDHRRKIAEVVDEMLHADGQK